MPETRYFRSDTALVNGLNTEKLLTAQSGAQYLWDLAIGGFTTVYWGIRVWKRTAGSAETEITAGTPVALVSRSATGSGTQANTWNCPGSAINVTDSIVVRVYYKIDAGAWTQIDTWQTNQLGSTSLDVTQWTVTYYTRIYMLGGEDNMIAFYADTALYLSQIANFSHSSITEHRIYFDYLHIAKACLALIVTELLSLAEELALMARASLKLLPQKGHT